MSISTAPSAASDQRAGPAAEAAAGIRSPAGAPPAGSARQGRGGTVLFEVPFHSSMRDADLARLARVLDLSTHMYPKQRPNPTSPGLARLDDFSGLYLERGPSDVDWVLEARTWGHPPLESVREWHLLSSEAAHQLDPAVGALERLPARRGEVADRPVGTVLNRRLARFRRRLVGLP